MKLYKYKPSQVKIITLLIIFLILEISIPLLFFKSEKLEFLKIAISLIGPLLTFRVFQNTLKIQDRQIKKDEANEVNRDFNNLLNLFLKRQRIDKEIQFVKESIEMFNKNYECSENQFKDGNFQKNEYKGLESPFLTFKVFDGEDIKINEYENKYHVLNKQYKSIYNQAGPYFKVLHRTIKILNKSLDENKISRKDYKMYIGIVRTQLSSDEFLFILYNSLYVNRGIGLGIQLVGSGLFGDTTDFKINQHFPTPSKLESYLELFTISEQNNELRIKLENEFENLKDDATKFKTVYTFVDFYSLTI